MRFVCPAGKRSDLTSATPKALVEELIDPLVVDAVEVGIGRYAGFFRRKPNEAAAM
jgi:hypothetical protein